MFAASVILTVVDYVVAYISEFAETCIYIMYLYQIFKIWILKKSALTLKHRFVPHQRLKLKKEKKT